VKKFIADHPIWFAVLVSMLSLGLGFVVSSLELLGVPRDGLMLVGVLKDIVIGLGLIWWLGWWRGSGFTITAYNIHDLWLPLLMMLVPMMVFGTIVNEPRVMVLIVALMFFTALGEEALSRGLFVQALLPLGKWHVVLIPSILFGLGHITQFLFLGMALTANLLQISYNIAYGMMYAALRLRVGSLWPLIGLHMVGNTLFVVAGLFGPNAIYEAPVTMLIVMSVIEIAYAIYLLRKPLVVTVADETSGSGRESIPVIKPT
jgi:membrane protease YdiL (CAAX protease family)